MDIGYQYCIIRLIKETEDTEKVRELIKKSDRKTLLEMWKALAKKNMENSDIAVSAIIETELENRGLIRLNEDTFEYETK